MLKKLGLIVSDLSLESVYSISLLGYSSLLRPIAGIMVVDCFLIRRQKLDLAGLYRDDVYRRGTGLASPPSLLPVGLTTSATAASAGSTTNGWFTGSLLGATLYYVFA